MNQRLYEPGNEPIRPGGVCTELDEITPVQFVRRLTDSIDEVQSMLTECGAREFAYRQCLTSALHFLRECRHIKRAVMEN